MNSSFVNSLHDMGTSLLINLEIMFSKIHLEMFCRRFFCTKPRNYHKLIK
ncbi:hypothetical protein BpHYR1_048182 [Brachionus plicatilis]|uniref:Uncharacterized protein n=1 Tax=Brachionus plicatilis TaxID=10195 RepID=A0A3M7PBJ3_BRAPC|nr:hypothetical protein BpHYR1_048182 [Brachionus plicatilis]